MNQFTLSIYFPTYNRCLYLQRSLSLLLPYLAAIQGDSCANVEVVISDNASCDQTENLIKSYNYSFLRYFKSHRNVGPIKNFFKSEQLCRSQYIWCVGDDDIILHEHLLPLFNYISDNQPDFLFLDDALVDRSNDSNRLIYPLTLEALFTAAPITSLAHISRVIYKKSILTEFKNSIDSLPAYYVWPWIAPAVSLSKSIKSYCFEYPIVFPTKDGGSDIWTGKTATSRLVEFDRYILSVCNNSDSIMKAYQLNFGNNFPLLATFLKSLIIMPSSRKALKTLASNLKRYSGFNRKLLFLMDALTSVPLPILVAGNRFVSMFILKEIKK